ncbi:MAG: FecR family protein [Saprospiraceae bacterium]
MDIDFYLQLLIKKWKGILSQQDNEALEYWLNQSTNNRAYAKEMKQAWDAGDLYDLPFELDEVANFDKVLQKINTSSDANLKETKAPKVVQMPKRNFRKFFSIAAGFLLLLSVGAWLYKNNFQQVPERTIVATTEMRQLQLSDGTKVWLNKNSKVSYPETFDGQQRWLKLEGEAYFQVAPNSQQPFSITTSNATVTVLGTAFNLRANPLEDKIEVAVEEGKVRLQPHNSRQFIDLTAKEKGVYLPKDKKLERNIDRNLNALAWQRKRLVFRDTPLRLAIQTIAEFHNVTIHIAANNMKNCPFTGRYDTTKPLETLLKEVGEVLKMELVENGATDFTLIGGICK